MKTKLVILVLVIALFVMVAVVQARDRSTLDDTTIHFFEVGNMTCVAIRTQWQWSTPAVDGISCDWDEYPWEVTR